MDKTEEIIEKKRVLHSLVFPVFFLFVLWMVKLSEVLLQTRFVFLGVFPLKAKGLLGIITAPLVHGSFNHLIDNSIPLFLLSWALFYFYNKIAYKVYFLSWIMTGIWVWFGGRYAYHIGASGLIYSVGAFLFVSGIIRKNTHLMAISLLVIFLYGSMVWGIFPLKENISWESHLMGLVAGIILALYYRNEGPPIKKPFWEEEEFDDESENNFDNSINNNDNEDDEVPVESLP